MQIHRIAVGLIVISLLTLVVACGGGGGIPFIPIPTPVPADPPPADPPPADPPPALPPASGTWLSNVYNQLPAESSATRAFQNQVAQDTATQILNILNSERAAEGLAPLALDIHLERVAQAHGLDMATQGYFAHEGLNGMLPWDRLDQINPPNYTASGENIAAGQSGAVEVMLSWMDSPGHRANILNGVFNYVGIGVYNDPASPFGVYYVQMFATFPGDPNAWGGWYVAP